MLGELYGFAKPGVLPGDCENGEENEPVAGGGGSEGGVEAALGEVE